MSPNQEASSSMALGGTALLFTPEPAPATSVEALHPHKCPQPIHQGYALCVSHKPMPSHHHALLMLKRTQVAFARFRRSQPEEAPVSSNTVLSCNASGTTSSPGSLVEHDCLAGPCCRQGQTPTASFMDPGKPAVTTHVRTEALAVKS